MNRLLSFAIALATVIFNITVAKADPISSTSRPLCDSIIASNKGVLLSDTDLKPYAGFPEIWRSRSSNYENKAFHQRILEESKWAEGVFNEVSKRFKLYKTKYGVRQTGVSCRVLYRVKSDRSIDVAFTRKSDDTTFDSFLNGIFKSLEGASVLTFPKYIEETEKKEKRKCLAVSFEYDICLNSIGEIEAGPIQFYDHRPVKSYSDISKLNKPREMRIIDDRKGSYDSMSVRYYFKK